MDPVILAGLIGGGCTVAAAYVGAAVGNRRGRNQGEANGKKIGYNDGYRAASATYRQKYESAIQQFCSALGGQIRAAHSAMHDQDVHARAIVKVRDEFRENLSNLYTILNSEIDHLKVLLEKRTVDLDDKDLPEQIKQSIGVLHLSWPEKEKLLRTATRKLFAEFGLVESEPESDKTPG